MPDHYEETENMGKAKKLTTWSNEPSIQDLKQNITDAKLDSDAQKSKVNKWLDYMNIEGEAKMTKVTGRSNVQPKLIRKQAEWRYSSLTEPFLSTPDIFNIYPVSAGDKKRALQNELVLNNQINTKLDKVEFFDQYVREAVDTGTVIVKIGWKYKTVTKIKTRPVYEYIRDDSGQTAQRYMIILQKRMEDPEGYYDISTPGLDEALRRFEQTGIAEIPHEIGQEEYKETETVCNHPSWEVKDMRNIIVDPSCNGNYKEASFIVEWFKSSKSALKADGKYENIDAIQTSNESPLSHPDYVEGNDNSQFKFADKPREQFVVHEYWGNWDIDGSGEVKPIVAAWVGDTLIRMEENPFPDQKPPFVIAKYLPVRRSVYGEPDAGLLIDNQKIIGAVTRGMIDLLARSAASQTGMRKDMLDVTNRRKFERGEDYEFNAGVDPRQGVHQHTFPEIPQSAYNMLSMQNNEAESMSGVKAFTSEGISGRSLGATATSARSALDAASKRELGILRRLSTGIIEIGRKFIAMNAEFLSDEEVIRITANQFITIRRDDLPGNFDLQLAISSAEEDNQKAEELAFMLQTNGPNSDPAEVRMIRAEIARLRKMPALAKRIEEYQPEPDPLAVAKAELEVALLEAQIAKERALEAKHMAEAGLSGSRSIKEETQAQVNVAKARDLGSDSDLKNLDFVEQESGVKQERDLEKIGRQAQATAATEIVKGRVAQQGNNARQ